jgi:hypothetical protein
MNVLAIGTSHLAAFKAACEALLPDCGRVQYLPSPQIVNAGDFFGGRTLVARLQFAGPDATEVAVHDPAETHLVIVGNGLFGHFAVFCPAPDRKLPCFVWSDDLAPSLPVLASCAWSSRLVSRSLFRELYADGVRHHVLQRWSMTPDFLRRFRKVTMFASPTPGARFFVEHSACPDVAAYLGAGCLRVFKANYRALVDEFVATLPCAVAVSYPIVEEDTVGCTQDRFLLAEEIQVHANHQYWTSRITSAIEMGMWS